MHGEPPDDLPPGQRRPFTRVESFFMFLCLVLPGVSALGFALVGFGLAYGNQKHGDVITVTTLVLFLAFVAGCSWFAGHLVAAKSGGDGRKSRTIKSALVFFLAQIFLVPAIGWATCMTFVAASG